MSVLLVMPPFYGFTRCYASLPQLTGYLRGHGIEVVQQDLNIELCREAMQPNWVSYYVERAERRFEELEQQETLDREEQRIYYRISRALPYAGEFQRLSEDLRDGRIKIDVLAEYWHMLTAVHNDGIELGYDGHPDLKSTLYRTWLTDDPHTFCTTKAAAEAETMVDRMGLDLLDKRIEAHDVKVVGISLPFTDQLISGYKIARHIKEKYPHVHLVAGGPYVSAHYRSTDEPRYFDFFDTLVVDDGRKALRELIGVVGQHGPTPDEKFLKPIDNILFRRNGRVVRTEQVVCREFASYPAPCFDGVEQSLYLDPKAYELSFTLAYGCYWHRCTFCDTKLPYVRNYIPQSAKDAVDRIVAMVEETGCRSVHFVDEACPPKLLVAISTELLRRDCNISWWGNVRLEKAYTKDVCRLLARAGCRAVSAGYESSSDETLRRMGKGQTSARAQKVIANFAAAGIGARLYMIVGFPGESEEEAHRSMADLERMMNAGQVESAGWHAYHWDENAAISRMSDAELGLSPGTLDPYREGKYAVARRHRELREVFQRRTVELLRRAKQRDAAAAAKGAWAGDESALRLLDMMPWWVGRSRASVRDLAFRVEEPNAEAELAERDPCTLVLMEGRTAEFLLDRDLFDMLQRFDGKESLAKILAEIGVENDEERAEICELLDAHSDALDLLFLKTHASPSPRAAREKGAGKRRPATAQTGTI